VLWDAGESWGYYNYPAVSWTQGSLKVTRPVNTNPNTGESFTGEWSSPVLISSDCSSTGLRATIIRNANSICGYSFSYPAQGNDGLNGLNCYTGTYYSKTSAQTTMSITDN